jgi:hypothetical protein
VVLHGKFSRRYRAVREYLQAVPVQHRNLLLLTDDENAVSEALHRHPQYSWFSLDRPRHKGSEGGWENQVPSDDPAWEVVALHAEFLLVQQCDVLVHSKSNLADYYYAIMLQTNSAATHVDLDADTDHHKIHRADNAASVQISQPY